MNNPENEQAKKRRGDRVYLTGIGIEEIKIRVEVTPGHFVPAIINRRGHRRFDNLTAQDRELVYPAKKKQ